MTVKFSFYFFAVLIAFSACKSNNQSNFISINKSVEKSSINLKMANEAIYKELEHKLSERGTTETAKIWQPKAEVIHTISTKIFDYIGELKRDFTTELLTQSKATELYEKLREYEKNIRTIDSDMSEQMKKIITPITYPFDIEKQTASDFFDTFFKDTSTISTTTILTTFQNNIRIREHEMITFCTSKVGSVSTIISRFGVLIGQNTTHLKKGETLEISAGVGVYISAAKPQINIDGKTVECIDGKAKYEIKAPTKTGKHYLPVKIEFTDQNGVKQIQTTNVEYTVDE